MQKAIVTKPFKGVPDGQTQPVQFEKGDEVTGDLARVALQEKWAKKSRKRAEDATQAESEAEDTQESGEDQPESDGDDGNDSDPDSLV